MNVLVNLNDCKEFMVIKINNQNHQIKLAGSTDDPYFCGKDVCVVLGYDVPKMALHRYVEDDEKKSSKELNNELVTAAVTNSMLGKYYEKLSYHDGKAVYVSEAGLYDLIMSSQAPFAKEFRKLVCKVILPSIRKYGSYSLEKEFQEKLQIKDNELQQAVQAQQKAERKALNIRKFMNNINIKEHKLEWIYIATTNLYAQDRIFKIGSTERLATRIAPYKILGPLKVIK